MSEHCTLDVLDLKGLHLLDCVACPRLSGLDTDPLLYYYAVATVVVNRGPGQLNCLRQFSSPELHLALLATSLFCTFWPLARTPFFLTHFDHFYIWDQFWAHSARVKVSKPEQILSKD